MIDDTTDNDISISAAAAAVYLSNGLYSSTIGGSSGFGNWYRFFFEIDLLHIQNWEKQAVKVIFLFYRNFLFEISLKLFQKENCVEISE